MAPPTTHSARDALKQQATGTGATAPLLRALASHPSWILQASLIDEAEGVSDSGESLALDEPDAPPDTAYLFIDHDAVEAARSAGIAAGRLISGVPGTRALATLGRRLDACEINAGSPDDARWTIGHRKFPMLRLWAMTIEAEQGLEAAEQAGAKVELVRTHPSWFVLTESDGKTPLAETWPERTGQFALAFTAADQLAAYTAGEQVDHARFRGSVLIDTLVAMRFRGIVVNPALDAPPVVPLRPA